MKGPIDFARPVFLLKPIAIVHSGNLLTQCIPVFDTRSTFLDLIRAKCFLFPRK